MPTDIQPSVTRPKLTAQLTPEEFLSDATVLAVIAGILQTIGLPKQNLPDVLGIVDGVVSGFISLEELPEEFTDAGIDAAKIPALFDRLQEEIFDIELGAEPPGDRRGGSMTRPPAAPDDRPTSEDAVTDYYLGFLASMGFAFDDERQTFRIVNVLKSWGMGEIDETQVALRLGKPTKIGGANLAEEDVQNVVASFGAYRADHELPEEGAQGAQEVQGAQGEEEKTDVGAGLPPARAFASDETNEPEPEPESVPKPIEPIQPVPAAAPRVMRDIVPAARRAQAQPSPATPPGLPLAGEEFESKGITSSGSRRAMPTAIPSRSIAPRSAPQGPVEANPALEQVMEKRVPAMPRPFIPSAPSVGAGTDASRILAQVGAAIPADLQKRFLSIVDSRLREARNPYEVQAILERDPQNGGIGLSGSAVADVMVAIEDAKSAQEAKQRAGVSVELDPKVMAEFAHLQEAGSGQRAAGSRIQEAGRGQREGGASDSLPSSLPPPSTLPPPPRPVTMSEASVALGGAKKSMTDVRGLKLSGPVEQIRRLTLTEFRRLSKDPAVAVEKLVTQVRLLEQEGFDKKEQAVLAWRSSPLYRTYVELSSAAMTQGVSIEEYAAAEDAKTAAKRDFPSAAEIKAIISLNEAMRF